MGEVSGGQGRVVLSVVIILALVTAMFIISLNPQNEPGDITLPTITWDVTTPPIPEHYVAHEPIVITGNSDLVSQAETEEWSGDGTLENPYLISEYHINAPKNCISISDVSLFVEIQECYLETATDPNGIGVRVTESTHVGVSLCTILSADEGVQMSLSSLCIVSNCTIIAMAGVNLTVCADIVAFGNLVMGCYFGFVLVGTNNTELCDNTMVQNEWAIFSQFSYDNYIHHNDVVFNNHGIELDEYCAGWGILLNNVLNNTGIGIELGVHVSNITVTWNRIGWNYESNARDDGSINFWDDGEQGNFWSDYDGTGDYLIPGSAGSVDHFPALLVIE